MSPSRIEIQFMQLNQAVEQLVDLADQIKNIANSEMPEIAQSVKSCWLSENAELLMEAERKAVTEAAEIAENIIKEVEKLSQKANQFFQIERLNNMTANVRNYK